MTEILHARHTISTSAWSTGLPIGLMVAQRRSNYAELAGDRSAGMWPITRPKVA